MAQNIVQGVSLINLETFKDDRGAFESIWGKHQLFMSGLNFEPSSASFSYNTKKSTLRGMHYQASPYQQAKLVVCVNGKLWDVVVDLRKDSPTYKNWRAVELTARSGKALFIPRGCAHGFLTLVDNTTLAYLIEGQYMPEQSCVLSWNDPEIDIDWPIDDPILSDRDKRAPWLSEL